MAPMHGGGERITSIGEISRCRGEFLNRKWPHFKEEVAIRKVRTVKKPLNWGIQN
jgi:hypothetical protein